MINENGAEMPEIDSKLLTFSEVLGEGVSAKVYKGLYSGKDVAIKVFKPMNDEKQKRNITKELEIMCTVRCPSVLEFHGVCQSPKLCLVMEFCNHGSLYHYMNDEANDFTWDLTLRFATESTKDLLALHSWNPTVLHRDLKSLNFLVDKEVHVKISDFGLSRLNTETNKSTLAKMRGTFAYAPPEVYYGHPFTKAGDIYSLSIVLWELLARCMSGVYERPYKEYKNLQAGFQVIIQVSKNNLRPTIPADSPSDYVALLKKMWSGDPTQRPDCQEIVMALEKMQGDLKAHPENWKCKAGAARTTSSEKKPMLTRTQGLKDLKKFTADDLAELQGFQIQ